MESLNNFTQVEKEMGSVSFLILYVAAGIFGNVLGGNFALVGIPSMGASGAIFGTVAVSPALGCSYVLGHVPDSLFGTGIMGGSDCSLGNRIPPSAKGEVVLFSFQPLFVQLMMDPLLYETNVWLADVSYHGSYSRYRDRLYPWYRQLCTSRGILDGSPVCYCPIPRNQHY
jgi:hypothetical protein